MHLKKLILVVTILSGSGISCTSEMEQIIPAKRVDYYIPEVSETLQVHGFPQPERNPISEQGVILGKKLFFDPNLSSNGKVSCASCHEPALAFTDHASLGAKGVSGNMLHRNAPALFNLAWQINGLFWDGGAVDLESLNFGPLTHPDEMGANLDNIVDYLANDQEYPLLFEAAFPNIPIQSAYISRAISQYVRTLISQSSVYDSWKLGKAKFSDLQLQGYQVYKKNCASCHTEGLFTDGAFHNNGLDQNYPDPPHLEGLYLGRYRITFDASDLGAYRTPSLRNLFFTTPYMHDGRLKTLEEVLDHYESGIQANSSLAAPLQKEMHFTQDEKNALLAFLKTLTDIDFIQQHSVDN